jgi:hypothetical protein
MKSQSTQVSVKEAAEILGVTEQCLRIGLQRGKFDIFGRAIDMSGKNKRYKYVIFRDPLIKFVHGDWQVQHVDNLKEA